MKRKAMTELDRFKRVLSGMGVRHRHMLPIARAEGMDIIEVDAVTPLDFWFAAGRFVGVVDQELRQMVSRQQPEVRACRQDVSDFNKVITKKKKL